MNMLLRKLISSMPTKKRVYGQHTHLKHLLRHNKRHYPVNLLLIPNHNPSIQIFTINKLIAARLPESNGTFPRFFSSMPDPVKEANIFDDLGEDEIRISDIASGLFSEAENDQATACKDILELLAVLPSPVIESSFLPPSPSDHAAARSLWSSLFDADDIEDDSATSNSAAHRASGTLPSPEEEEDAAVSGAATGSDGFGFDAVADLVRAAHSLGGLRCAGGAVWDLTGAGGGMGPTAGGGGSGGRGTLAAALLHDFDSAHGIEADAGALARARRALAAFERARRGERSGKVRERLTPR
jgi:hypothetical protein